MRSHVEAEAVVEDLLRTPDGRRNPYPRYHRLRDLAPVHRSEVARAWLLTRYDDCRSVLRDPRFERRFSDVLDANSDGWRQRPALGFASRSMLMLDPPDHTRLRRRVARTFTPKRVAELRPRIHQLVTEMLDGFVAGGGGDLVERLAFQIPVIVIGDLLGIPRDDLDEFRQPVLDLTASLEVPATRDGLDRADDGHAFCAAYLAELVDRRRVEPTDDLLGRLLADDGDDPLDDQELVDLLLLLFVAGFETTTNLIGNGVVALHDQPDQLALLRDDPTVAPNVADELLRHAATIQLSNRVPVEDVQVGGETIPAGDNVFVLLGAANRDPARYPDPDRLDFRRTDILPLTFGGGIHYCLGAALASVEVEVFFAELARRVDRIEFAAGRPEHRDRLAIRGADSISIQIPKRTPPADPLASRPAGDDTSWRDAYRRRLDTESTLLTEEELADRVALLLGHEFFSGCRSDDLSRLAATAYPVAFDAGDEMVVQGAPSPDAYVIAEGTADVVIDGRVVDTLGQDDLVGERGFVTGTPRAATVVATTHLIAYALSSERLRDLLESDADAAQRMRDVVASRYPAVSRTP